MSESEIKVGRTYRFIHSSKGIFVGKLLSIEEGDKADPKLWRVQVFTGPGSGNERLANAMIRDEQGKKVTPPRSTKLIRPSHVESFEEVI